MIFKSLINENADANKERIEKIYIKLLAFGVNDFTDSYQIIEKFQKSQDKRIPNHQDIPLDLLVYEHLAQKKIAKSDFNAKCLLSITFPRNFNNLDEIESKLDSIFPKKTKVSSMTPSPIHFGPLEGFLSDSLSDIDLKTLIFTIGFWFIVYGLIIYNLYF